MSMLPLYHLFTASVCNVTYFAEKENKNLYGYRQALIIAHFVILAAKF